MSLSTPLTKQLGIELPIVQAPIGSATCPELAASVSQAGGLGMLAITWRDLDESRTVIQQTQKLTEKPFGINLVLDENARSIPTADHLEICATEGIDIVSFSFGDSAERSSACSQASPGDSEEYVDQVHSFGGTVLQTVGSAEEAERATTAGCDIVVAQGWEAGGHVQSEVATLPFVPRVADAVDVPVIAAGGIADGRGIAAALVLEADGAWLGTRFLATKEAYVHATYQEKVLTSTETETQFGTIFDRGWPDAPHRVIRNSTVEEWEKAGRPAGDRPNEEERVASLPNGTPVERYADSLAIPEMEGDIEALPLYAGQSTGLITTAPSAATIVERLARETENALDRP